MIEMLIVILVISIIAMLVVPRLLGARRRAKEAQLLADLKQLRDSIERFEATTGAWPPDIHDVTAANPSAISADFDGRGGYVDRSAYDGPYLVVNGDPWLPLDPFTQQDDWNYDNTTGAVHSKSDLNALNGTPYNTW
jgi:type II secretory pathway pseudopilin PulG